MRYVDLNAQIGDLTGVLDPRPYLDELEHLAPLLPPGARAFATEPGHYDFVPGDRCVKDLKLVGIHSKADAGSLTAYFRHHCWKHYEDLVIDYRGVVAVDWDGTEWPNEPEVVLDEILPHANGCTHEIALRPGTVTVTCADLDARWFRAVCAEDPGL